MTKSSWLDRMTDFLLGPSPHPMHVAAAAAGFGGAVERPVHKPRERFSTPEDREAGLSLAASGLGNFMATDGHGKGTDARYLHGH